MMIKIIKAMKAILICGIFNYLLIMFSIYLNRSLGFTEHEDISHGWAVAILEIATTITTSIYVYNLAIDSRNEATKW